MNSKPELKLQSINNIVISAAQCNKGTIRVWTKLVRWLVCRILRNIKAMILTCAINEKQQAHCAKEINNITKDTRAPWISSKPQSRAAEQQMDLLKIPVLMDLEWQLNKALHMYRSIWRTVVQPPQAEAYVPEMREKKKNAVQFFGQTVAQQVSQGIQENNAKSPKVHFDSLLMTRMRAAFSSFSLWLSARKSTST